MKRQPGSQQYDGFDDLEVSIRDGGLERYFYSLSGFFMSVVAPV